ncbi:MAG: UDP-glucose 4-epimerase GalE [Elusimicrobiota bacterium]
MKKGKVLVVGGAGYIGSQCAKELHARGYEPVALDNLCTGHKDLVRWGRLVEGDVLDFHLLNNVFGQNEFHSVMHFAAHAVVSESVEDPAQYYRNNVAGTLSLLEAMVRHGVKNVVFSSTCATYGLPKQVPIPENHPQDPINPYGMTKLTVERMLADFHKAYGLQYMALRYFNAAGADPDGETGEDHDPETHLIPLALAAAMRKDGSVKIFGTDYDTPDGTCIRDYVHTVDLAGAHVACMERLMDGCPSTVYNLGNGEGYSVYEVVEAVRRVTGVNMRVQKAPRRPGDPPRLVAASERARRELSWQPRFPDLDSMVKTAYAWAKGRAGAAV